MINEETVPDDLRDSRPARLGDEEFLLSFDGRLGEAGIDNDWSSWSGGSSIEPLRARRLSPLSEYKHFTVIIF